MRAVWTRRILITGATKGGIGFEAARQLLAQGHRVVLTLRDLAKGQDAVETLVSELLANSGQSETQARERVQWVKLDLLSFSSVRAAGDEIRKKFTSLDALLVINLSNMEMTGAEDCIT
jgi:NAD(P)-dependent dehydrogenase (short-subunit alcohol dehydrogenase family)